MTGNCITTINTIDIVHCMIQLDNGMLAICLFHHYIELLNTNGKKTYQIRES